MNPLKKTIIYILLLAALSFIYQGIASVAQIRGTALPELFGYTDAAADDAEAAEDMPPVATPVEWGAPASDEPEASAAGEATEETDADAGADGLFGAVHVDFLPLDINFTRGGRIHAVQLIHQRALTGAVLAQDGVDLTLVHGELDAVVGGKITEFFGDVPHVHHDGVQVQVWIVQK